uniref:DDE Tnp4 domain-containing protein n=1 Tax=Amphimedon queenslandica TaxID=400682 RepID=A0A1X7TMZ7_AMPQE
AWGRKVLDKVITQKSGFFDYISCEDVVMADRGFNIADDLAVCGAHLTIPASTRGEKQLEIEKSRQLAYLRIL